MTKKEKRYKIYQIEHYEDIVEDEKINIINRTSQFGWSLLVTIMAIFVPLNSIYFNAFDVVELILGGLNGVINIYQFSKIKESFYKIASLQGTIDYINNEIDSDVNKKVKKRKGNK